MASFARGAFLESAFSRSGAPSSTLFDRVQFALKRLAPLGWLDLFAEHGLDIAASDLAAELARPLVKIDRGAPGFQDFALDGARGIEPGAPAQSLLYHAVASPSVTASKSHGALHGFPTLAEIEAVEDYVYGVEPPSIEDLRVRAKGARLAIAVFALEYRTAAGTVHQRHADLLFSRTGVARIGTRPAQYLPTARGYLPFVDGDGTLVRTLPCRYAAFIAALVPGEQGTHGPLRFIFPDDGRPATSGQLRQSAGLGDGPRALAANEPGDAERLFWVPLHKLFSGSECIRGRDIEIRLSASHTNEKLRRAHLKFLSSGHNGGWTEPDISEPPFIFHDNIANFSSSADDGGWLLCPQPHPRLVEAATYRGKPLTYAVPSSASETAAWTNYSSSLNLKAQPSGARAAPEYLHARHKVEEDGGEVDLNDLPHVAALVKAGGYRARHYLDYTADGWIDVECSELALDLPRRLPAYSMVTAPDFFPFVDQTALMQWTDQSVLPSLLKTLWDSPGSGLPQALSDQRFAANLQLNGANFDPYDDTMTAIVGLHGSGRGTAARITPTPRGRASMLPDSAAGVFAPGWDVSYDRTSETDPEDTGKNLASGVTFLTNYGLGSPFPEDSKLCAALASFWPAAAPDTTRTFSPARAYATATPLTDDVIGLEHGPPWDGIQGPVLNAKAGVVEYASLAYGDYVDAALAGRFDISVIGRTSAEEYIARTLTMALVYKALGVERHDDKLKYSVLSFRHAVVADIDLLAAQKATGRRLDPRFTYRYQVFDHVDRSAPDPKDFKRVQVKFGTLTLLFADPTLVLMQDDQGDWSAIDVRR